VKLAETLLVLFDNKVQYVLIGGRAMQLQGWPRLTEDLDFCHQRSKQNVERLAEALVPFHVTLRGAPPNLSFRFDVHTIQSGLNFTLQTDLGPLDFLAEVSGPGSYDAVAAEAEIMNIFGLNHKVLSIVGLIRAKKAAARAKDVQAIVELEARLEYRERTKGRS